MTHFFNVRKHSDNTYLVDTKFNKYELKVDEVKGIGIYLITDESGCGILIKSMKHTHIEKAIIYLWDKTI